MTNVIHNYGLELPKYKAETHVAWTAHDIAMAARTETRFVRRVMFHSYPERFDDLKAGLKVARAVLSLSADLFDADLVDFEWGLYEGPVPKHVAGRHFDSSNNKIPLVPRGYSLVADVAAVHPCIPIETDSPLRIEPESLREIYKRAMAASPNNPGFYIPDVRISHFVNGCDTGLTWVDIDAYLMGQ